MAGRFRAESTASTFVAVNPHTAAVPLPHIDRPGASPLVPANGDILFLALRRVNGLLLAGQNMAITNSSGWTRYAVQDEKPGERLEFYWKASNGADPIGFVVDVIATGTTFEAHCLWYDGLDPSTVGSGTRKTGGGTNVQSVTLSPSLDGTTYIHHVHLHAGGLTSQQGAIPHTERVAYGLRRFVTIDQVVDADQDGPQTFTATIGDAADSITTIGMAAGNRPPSVPNPLFRDGQQFDLSAGGVIPWDFLDPDLPDDHITATRFRRRPNTSGSAWSWWNGTTWAATETAYSVTAGTVAENSAAMTNLTFPAGAWPTSGEYLVEKADRDQRGAWGAYRPSVLIDLTARPVITLSKPDDSTIDTSWPPLEWVYSDAENDRQDHIQVRVYELTDDVAAASVAPPTTAFGVKRATWSFDLDDLLGTVRSIDLGIEPGGQPARFDFLNKTRYRVYLRARQFGGAGFTGAYSDWKYRDFTLNLRAPTAPSLLVAPTLDPQTGAPRNTLTVVGHQNLMGKDAASFETSVGGWHLPADGNASVTLDGTKSADGIQSLKLTALASGDVHLVSPDIDISTLSVTGLQLDVEGSVELVHGGFGRSWEIGLEFLDQATGDAYPIVWGPSYVEDGGVVTPPRPPDPPPATFTVLYSLFPNRSEGAALTGVNVTSDSYVFVADDSDIASVEWTIDGQPVTQPEANRDPVIQSIGWLPANPHPGDTVTVTAVVTDPDGDPVSYAWAWTGLTVEAPPIANADTSTVTFQVSKVGGHGLGLTARDNRGGSAVKNVNVDVTQAAGVTAWEEDVLWDAPDGWDTTAWNEVIVAEDVSNVSSSEGAAGVKNGPFNVSLGSGKAGSGGNWRVVMPMPGDFYGHTKHRYGRLVVQGGNHVVFCVRRKDGTYRRGGFALEIPRMKPFPTRMPAADTSNVGATAHPDGQVRNAMQVDESGSTTLAGRVVDIVGCLIFGADAAEGIQYSGLKTIFQLQRSRVQDIHYRCGADRSAGNGNTADGFTPTSPYAANGSANTHPDGVQTYKVGWFETRMHDVTVLTGMGHLTFTNSGESKGDLYLSRCNTRSHQFSCEEYLGLAGITQDPGNNLIGGVNQGARWYVHFGSSSTLSTIKRVFIREGTVWLQRPKGEVNGYTRGLNSMMNPSGGFDYSTYNGTTDGGWVEGKATFKANGVNERCVQKWDGGWNHTTQVATGTDSSVSGRFYSGRPAVPYTEKDYAPLDMWGGDGNSYKE